MRDERFKAIHRGGSLDLHRHRLLAAWAADCAEHVLPLFSEQYPQDDRPWRAIETARAWSRGKVTVGEARAAGIEAHAAARDAAEGAARAAARAAGQAVGTAHMADHAPQAAVYAVKAVQAAGNADDVMAANRERAWQQERLPEEIRALILPNG
jgi:hypothetical protein